ncbi:MAG: hypothetical protein JNJ52_00395 [Flavobacterium sp.]|nr:hypothetical protein [Flavobacterium sp.]
MHENLRTRFSIKAEDNQQTSKWQHIRSERMSLSFFSIYGKMLFSDIHENFAKPEKFSFLLHEFKKGILKFGFSNFNTELDLYYDIDIEEPIYHLKITLSPLKIDDNVNNLLFKVKSQPSILNCNDLNYVNNFKNDIVNQFSGDFKDYLNMNYLIYFDVTYENTPAEDDDKIDFLNFFKTDTASLSEIILKTESARVDPATGRIITDRCRPVYVKLT